MSFHDRSPGSSGPARSRRGSVAIWSAISALVVVGIVGLAVDTAWVLSSRMQLQRTADAAALAGAAKLTQSGQIDYGVVRQTALDTAAANPVSGCCPDGVLLDPNLPNAPEGDVVVGRWTFDESTHTWFFDPSSTPADAVQVRAGCGEGTLNPPLQLLFGPIFGVGSSRGFRPAVARLSAPVDPLLLLLDPNRQGSFLMNGGANIDVDEGFMQVNSADACAVRINGSSGSLSAQRISVVGGTCAAGTITGDVFTAAPPVPDPYATVPEPSAAALGLATRPAITSPGVYAPGYYPEGIDLCGGTARLQPGVYVIGNQSPGRGINLTGSGFLAGDGVTIFLEDGARLRTSGSGAGMALTPTASGPWAGITIFQARTNAETATIYGGGVFDVAGAIYLANAAMSIGGNPGRRIGRLVAGTLDISGDGVFAFTGAGIPPSTNPRYVYLVQ